MKTIIVYCILLISGFGAGIGVFKFSDSASRTTADQTSDHVAVAEEHSAPTTLDWCAEHRVPESECTFCHPDLIDQFKAKNDWCGEHDLPESHCRLCNPEIRFPQEPMQIVTLPEPVSTSVFFPANAQNCATDHALIQFASQETAARVGITVEQAIEATDVAPVEAPAEICFDETKMSLLTVSIPVTVSRWLIEPGETVRLGQALAELESPHIADLQAEFLKARADNAVHQQEFARLTSLRERELISSAEFEKAQGESHMAEAQLKGSEGLLRAAGLSDDDIEELTTSQRISPRFLLRASAAGMVVERKAPLGELLPEGTTLARIGDPAALWVEAQVRETDLELIRPGQHIEFSSDGAAVERAGGTVIWVAQFLDTRTRTGTVRAKLVQHSRPIRAHLFGRARFYTESPAHALVVSKDAVQWEGCCNVVFVQEAVDRYRPRKVTVERGDHAHYRITSGLAPGEPVAVKGSYLLKTELKKGSIGAGCCGIEAKP